MHAKSHKAKKLNKLDLVYSIRKNLLIKFSLIFLLSLLMLYFRRSQTLLHAQFWAEDGSIWYQAAYNSDFSLLTIFKPYAGYLGVFPRLIAELSWPLNINNVPLFFNIVALIVQTLPVLYLWSSRFKHIVPGTKYRVILTFLYLCLPYTAEIHGTITNSQWYLALLAFMLLFAAEPKNRLLKILDSFLLLLAGLSGPFCIFLSLIALFEYISNTSERDVLKRRLAIILSTTILQLLFIVFGDVSRVAGSVGFSFTQLFNILGGQVFGSGLYGHEALTFFLHKPWIAPIVAVLGIELMVYAFLKGPKVLKYFIAFSTFVFMASLFSPPGKIAGGFTWWQLLANTISGGGRYYFLLHLAVILTLFWYVFYQRVLILKVFATLILLSSVLIGYRADFTHQPYADYNFSGYVKRYDHLKRGQQMDIPINPGPPWHVHLIKD